MPGWFIEKRATRRFFPVKNCKDTKAVLVVYENLTSDDTSLYIKDRGGFIYLGLTHQVLNLKVSEDLEAVSLARKPRQGDDKIQIKHDRIGYEWAIPASQLAHYA